MTAAVTTKTTKPELLAAYEELSKEHEDFKALVVKKAMTAAKRHDWCEVTQRTLVSMGLESYLPTSFAVQQRDYSDSRWWDYDSANTEKSAVAAAKRLRKQAVENLKSNHEYSHRANLSRRFAIDFANGNVEAQLAEAKRLAEAYTSQTIPPFEAPEYPKFRVVERAATGTGKILRTIEV